MFPVQSTAYLKALIGQIPSLSTAHRNGLLLSTLVGLVTTITSKLLLSPQSNILKKSLTLTTQLALCTFLPPQIAKRLPPSLQGRIDISLRTSCLFALAYTALTLAMRLIPKKQTIQVVPPLALPERSDREQPVAEEVFPLTTRNVTQLEGEFQHAQRQLLKAFRRMDPENQQHIVKAFQRCRQITVHLPSGVVNLVINPPRRLEPQPLALMPPVEGEANGGLLVCHAPMDLGDFVIGEWAPALKHLGCLEGVLGICDPVGWGVKYVGKCLGEWVGTESPIDGGVVQMGVNGLAQAVRGKSLEDRCMQHWNWNGAGKSGLDLACDVVQHGIFQFRRATNKVANGITHAITRPGLSQAEATLEVDRLMGALQANIQTALQQMPQNTLTAILSSNSAECMGAAVFAHFRSVMIELFQGVNLACNQQLMYQLSVKPWINGFANQLVPNNADWTRIADQDFYGLCLRAGFLQYMDSILTLKNAMKKDFNKILAFREGGSIDIALRTLFPNPGTRERVLQSISVIQLLLSVKNAPADSPWVISQIKKMAEDFWKAPSSERMIRIQEALAAGALAGRAVASRVHASGAPLADALSQTQITRAGHANSLLMAAPNIASLVFQIGNPVSQAAVAGAKIAVGEFSGPAGARGLSVAAKSVKLDDLFTRLIVALVAGASEVHAQLSEPNEQKQLIKD